MMTLKYPFPQAAGAVDGCVFTLTPQGEPRTSADTRENMQRLNN